MSSSIFDKHPKKTILTMVVLLFVLMDFSLSYVYFRIMESRERTDLGIPHTIYHHDFIKNGTSPESGRLGDYVVYTNSLGFKDKSNRKIRREVDNRRIIFIGDSFTEGILLNYEDTFVGIIDSTVSLQNIEVLNAARVSYSPIIYWRKIKYLIEETKLKFDELIVFIDISDIDDEASYYDLSEDGNVIDQNDIEENNTIEPRDYGVSWLISNQSIEDVRLFLRKYFVMTSGAINLIHDLIFYDSFEIQENVKNDKNPIEDEKGINTWEYVLTDKRANWTFNDNYYQEFGEKGEPRLIKYMDKLFKLTKEHDIDLTIVVYPWPSQIWYEDLNSHHVQIWETWCNENKVDFINLFPSFIKLNLTEPKKMEIISKYYVPYDLHLNKAGNNLIAIEFLKHYFN